ncbi:hypothetical protein ACJJI4_09555 [Microbulbifer sp. TRSA002]|uniref:hypothetical protein n=1 Tax=Microbulbifer sp. TRSA002 TaxID=3243382 RepID=UPI004039F7E0
MTKINSPQSVGASSSSSNFQSLVEVSGDQTLNQTNPPKQSGFKCKLQVMGQRLRGALAFVMPGLKSSKNTRVPVPNEASSAGKVGRQSVDFGRLVRLNAFPKEAEDIFARNDLAQLENFKSKIDKEIEYLQAIAINFESDGEGDKYVKGEIETGGKSLKDLSRKCEAYLLAPEKDLTRETLDRSMYDKVYLMRILSTEGSQLKKVWTDTAEKAYTDESTEFMREFGCVINVGVTTEPQEYPTLDGYIDQLKAALKEDWDSKIPSNLKNLETLADKFVKVGSQFGLNVSGGDKSLVVDNLKVLRSLYQEENSNDEVSISGGSRHDSIEQNDESSNSFASLDPTEISFSEESVQPIDESSGPTKDPFSTAVDGLIKGYVSILNTIHRDFMSNMKVHEDFKESLREQNRVDLFWFGRAF